MLTKTRALVLRTLHYGDSKVIVDMFTEQFGYLSFMCSLPKSSRSKVKRQLLQPMMLLDLEIDYRQTVRLQRIRDMRIAYPFVSLTFDSVKLSLALFLSEFMSYALRGEQCNTQLFAYIEASLKWLDGCEEPTPNFHLVFMMRLSRFIGFFPNLEDFREGAYFDLRNGTFSDGVPLHTDYLLPTEAEKIIPLMRINYETMYLFRMSRSERRRCVELILMYYRLHVPAFPALKSLPVLHELFD